MDPGIFKQKHCVSSNLTLPVLLCAGFFLPMARAHCADIPTAAEVEFFEKEIRPILVQHCFECHGGDETDGGLSLQSSQSIRRGGDSGAAIVVGQPDDSLLIRAVRYDDQDLQMPPQNRLDANQVAALEKWVRMGAPDPRDDSVGPIVSEGMSIDEGRRFWSLQPIDDPAVPSAEEQDRIQTPIDAFIFARLNSAGLTPAPPADRRTLIRRITFDLIGLPPTPEQIERFVADDAPGAVDRLVDRLLDSPQYGERWGRHWLDVARYADSNGLDENLAFGNAWRYRDYVIDAFNSDKPFDRFLVEQIAGDLVGDVDRDSKTGTGFLVLGAKVLAEPDREKLEMDTIDEQLDTIGKTFLGLTLGCVRCHDHKFDPLKQTDYYALAAIFKSTKTFGDTNTGAIKHWNEHIFASDVELDEFKKLDEQIAAKNSAAASFKNRAIAKLRTESRSLATEYLVAATRFEPDDVLTKVAAIAEAEGLHSRVLHHCRLHLKYHADDPVFAAWHRFKQDLGHDAAEKVGEHYRELFAKVEAALKEAQRENPKANRVTDPQLEAARAALHDNSGFLAVPPKPEFAFDSETLAEYYRLMDQARVFESNAADVPAAMGVTDGEVQSSLPIHIRGSHLNLGRPIERAVPEVIRTKDPVDFSSQQSGRLELARWMIRPNHPLTARVYVNRIWRWHFGTGLVRTTENFGVLGDRPSHPKLLDYLATRLIESGWSTKALHRLIMRSSVYQMASRHPDAHAAERFDPENRLLWKFRMQRLEAEQVRDAILAVTGRLDPSIRGKTVPLRNRQFVFNHTSEDHTKYDSLRRAIYLPVIRNNIYTMFEQFDFPDPTMPTGDRSETTVAPQALLLLNSDLVIDSSNQLAARLLEESFSDTSRIEAAYLSILGRTPATDETLRAIGFIDDIASQSLTGSDTFDPAARLHAWSLLCQSLLASNEFLYVR